MAEVLTIVFSTGWTFLGAFVLLSVVGSCIVATATAINRDKEG